MAYLNDVFYADPNSAKLYTLLESDASNLLGATGVKPSAICVDIDKKTVWVVNTTSNSVSKFVDGSKVVNIPVGSTPMGICQTEAGVVYVTNYGDRTISKIEGATVTKTISVGVGPRGICATKDKTLWVANYVSSNVSKIVNDVKVLDIPVAYNPNGICATSFNAVYTANSVTGTVSKIYADMKVLDITVGKVPTGICIDKNNNIWVSNYESGTVSKIVNDVVTKTIDVGKGPSGIAVTANGFIYVMNYSENTISKIDGTTDEVVKTITASCYNPSAFGDFTGSQAYYVLVLGANSGKISYDDLDTNLQTMINTGGLSTIDASKVTYHNATYPTVEKALDYLFSLHADKLAIKSFTNNVNATTKTTISSVTFNWEFNKAATSVSITDGSGTSVGAISNTATSFTLTKNITTDTTFTLTATDGTTTVTATTSITFTKTGITVYAGCVANTVTTITPEIITSKLLKATVPDYNITFKFMGLDNGGAWPYFVVPSDAGLVIPTDFKVNNLNTSALTITEVTINNVAYKAYKLGVDVLYNQEEDLVIKNGTTIVDAKAKDGSQ